MTSETGKFDIDGLRNSLNNSPPEVSSLLLKTMLDSFKERVCINQCQFNRVICILRPKCPQRHFQDLLLQSGYKFSQIPQFCYSLRLKEIHENYNRNLPFSTDINIYLADFHRIFGLKKPRFHPKREFKKILAYFEITNVMQVSQTLFVIGFKKNILLIDLDQELVTINPNNWKIDYKELALANLQVLAKEYDLEVEIQEEDDSLLVLTFNLQNLSEPLNEEILEDIIRHSDSLMGYDAEMGEIYGEVSIPYFSRSSDALTLLILRRMFEDISSFFIPETVSQDKNKKLKTKSFSSQN